MTRVSDAIDRCHNDVLSLGLIGKDDVSTGQCGLAVECHHLCCHVQLAIVPHHRIAVYIWQASIPHWALVLVRTELERGILFFENFDNLDDLLQRARRVQIA